MGQRMSSALLGADCGHIISLAINFHLHRSLGVPTSIHTPSLNGLFGHQIHGLINVRFGELWPLDNTNSAVRSSTCVQCVVYLPGHHLPSTVSVAVPVCEIKRIPVCELRNKLQKWVGRTRHPLFLRHWDLFIGERVRERESVWMSEERRTHTNAVTIHLIVIYDWSCAAFSVSPPLVRGGRP